MSGRDKAVRKMRYPDVHEFSSLESKSAVVKNCVDSPVYLGLLLPVYNDFYLNKQSLISIIMFLDIIHRLVFCLKCRPVYISKHNVSETGFYLRPQVKLILLGPIDRASPHIAVARPYTCGAS
jgi:hypothetical protein